MKHKVRYLILLGLCLSLVSGCQKAPVASTKLYVLAAASLTDCMTELGQRFNNKWPAIELVFSFDSSGTLQRQIEEGAPADVFMSAATKQMDALSTKGFVEQSEVVALLENKVVLIEPTSKLLNLSRFEDVLDLDVELIAIGNEDVPVGQYTEQIFTHLGIWEEVRAKANLGTNVRQVLDWVATGNVDVGVVYATDATSSDQVRVICEAPKDATERVIYPVAKLAKSTQPKEAEDFIKFLQTEEAIEVFKSYGFSAYIE